MLQAAQEAEGSSTSSSEDELADAQVAVEEATSSGRIKAGNGGTLGSVFEVATLIFLAEWGDRSMLATIALGAAQVCGAGMRARSSQHACRAGAGGGWCRMLGARAQAGWRRMFPRSRAHAGWCRMLARASAHAEEFASTVAATVPHAVVPFWQAGNRTDHGCNMTHGRAPPSCV